MLTLTLRPATPADVPVAAAIIASALAEYQLPFEPDGRDADVRSFGGRAEHDDVVAELDGRPVGVTSVGPHGDPGVAWISKVFVVAGARGRGVGRSLLERAHDLARARGYRRVGLRTRSLFTRAVALYEAAGYRPDPTGEPGGDLVFFRDL